MSTEPGLVNGLRKRIISRISVRILINYGETNNGILYCIPLIITVHVVSGVIVSVVIVPAGVYTDPTTNWLLAVACAFEPITIELLTSILLVELCPKNILLVPATTTEPLSLPSAQLLLPVVTIFND